jgi:hypothetical protein
MSDADEITDDELYDLELAIAEERRREVAVEHLLFQTVAYVEKQHPGLLDHLEASLDHLGDSADDETKDDEAVRDVARLFIASLRKGRL